MKFAVVLHDVRSVHNVGSVFRTADAAGVATVYCCGITPTPLDRFKKVRQDFHKVALGAEQSVDWKYEKDTVITLLALKKEGWNIFAVEQSKGSVPYLSAPLPGKGGGKIALVLGNEVEGLPAAALGAADAILEIPMFGEKESLNVAVAFGIVVFGLRLRGATMGKWRRNKNRKEKRT